MDLSFNSVDLDLMYKYLPFIIYDESSKYINVLKNKFVIEEMYNSYLREFNDEQILDKYPYYEMATLSKLFIVLESFPNEIIKKHIEERLEKLMKGKNFRIPKSIQLEGENDNIMFQFIDRNSDNKTDSLEQVLKKMNIDMQTLVNMLKYVLSVYDIYDTPSVTNNVELKKNLQYMLAKTSTHMYELNQYYSKWCINYKIQDAASTFLENEKAINNIIGLSGILTTIYICLDQTNEIQLTAIKLNVMYNAIYMYLEILKQGTNFDETIHKHILINGLNIYLYKDYLSDYEFYASKFKKYCSQYYKTIAMKNYEIYTKTEEENVLKKYYRSIVVINYLRANCMVPISLIDSSIVSELINLDIELDPGLSRNKNKKLIKISKQKKRNNLKSSDDMYYKLEDFIMVDFECTECINVIQDLMSYPLMEVNTKLDTTLTTRLINVIIKYRDHFEDFPDINFWLHQVNKLANAINDNDSNNITQRAIVNSDGTIKSEIWHDIWLNSKNVLESIMNTIENDVELLKNTDNEFKKEEFISSINNNLSMINHNYIFYNSDVFKNELTNQFDYKILQYIIGAFYTIYSLEIDDIDLYIEKFKKLCDELSIIYFEKRLKELINEFWLKFDKKRLIEVLIISFMLKKIYNYDETKNQVLWSKYKETMYDHFMNYVKYYEKEYNNSLRHEHERIYIGYKLLTYISKVARYNTLNEKYEKLYISMKHIYNYTDEYIENGVINIIPNVATIIDGQQFGVNEIRCNIPEFNISDLNI